MRTLLIAALTISLLASCNSKTPEAPQETPAASPAGEEPLATEDEPQPASVASETPGTLQAAEKQVGNLPFVGRRSFETRPAVTGTGTPHRYVEIMPDGDVFFGYGQQNFAANAPSGERYLAGKYGKVLKCVFSKLEDTRYYIITRSAIIEVDESGRKLSSADCCTNEKVDLETQCPCEGQLFDPAPLPQAGS